MTSSFEQDARLGSALRKALSAKPFDAISMDIRLTKTDPRPYIHVEATRDGEQVVFVSRSVDSFTDNLERALKDLNYDDTTEDSK